MALINCADVLEKFTQHVHDEILIAREIFFCAYLRVVWITIEVALILLDLRRAIDLKFGGHN